MTEFPDIIPKAGRNVLRRRYLQEGETWDGLCDRVSAYIANSPCENESDKMYDYFYDMMYNLFFLPGSPCLKHAGISKASLFSCFVLGPIDDDLDSIFNVLKQAAIVNSHGGGSGFSFSRLRPDGARISNRGKSSGPLGFMRIYDLAIGDVIKQGGMRDSALIALLDYKHDDIFKFITAKDKENKILRNFNISVTVDNEFFDKCNIHGTRENKIFEEICNHVWLTGDPGLIFLERIREKDVKVNSEIEGVNPCFSEDTLIAVADGRNAVSIKDLVEEGKDVPVYAVNDDGIVEIKYGRNPRWTGKKELLEIGFDDGSIIKVTPNHEMILRNGERRKAKDLQVGDSLCRFNKRAEKLDSNKKNLYFRINTDTQDSTIDRIYESHLIYNFFNSNILDDSGSNFGWIKNDKIIHHKNGNTLDNRICNLKLMKASDHLIYHMPDVSGENNPMYGKNHKEETKRKIEKKTKKRFSNIEYQREFSNLMKEKMVDDIIRNKISLARKREWKKYYEAIDKKTDLKTIWIDDRLFVLRECEICKKEMKLPWGKREYAYCSRSCVNKSENHKRARQMGLRESSLIKQKNILNEQINIYNNLKLWLNRDPLFKEWKLECKNNSVPYRIRGKNTNGNPYLLKNFKDLKNRAESFNHRVCYIKKLTGLHDVYNITVDDLHTVGVITKSGKNKKGYPFFTGIFATQCGELPLEYMEACNLGAINVYKIYKVFGEGGFWGKLKEITHNAVRFLDNMIDVNTYPLEEIKKKSLENRRIGLGIMGFADLLIEKGLRYSSKDALNFAEKLMWSIREYSYETSCELGRERGSFPAIKKTELGIRRNITVNTQQPTGTLSLIAGVSPGIEPNFFRKWVRKDGTGEYEMQHPLANREVFEIAHEISPKQHIKMQVAFQKYIDAAVSKTVNLPETATVEDIKKIYLMANEYGLKGITCYRDRSKILQVINRR